MPTRYTVQAGDCIASIAFEHGFRPQDVWDDDANQELRERRGNGYVLEPGDIVVVPDLRPRAETAVTGRRHVFRRLDVPEKLHIVLRDAEAKPRSGVAYTIKMNKREAQAGTTGEDGTVTVWIPPAGIDASLLITGEDPIPLHLGHLEPVTTDSGLRARLTNLGFLEQADDDEEALRAAIAEFQQWAKLTPTGVADDDLRRALLETHES